VDGHIDEQAVCGVFASLGLPTPPLPISGVDVFLPLLERMKQEGAVVLLKWDGERSTNHYTALASKAKDEEFFRLDGPSAEAVLSSVVVNYARRYWGCPKE
jgi:hypothetical protein